MCMGNIYVFQICGVILKLIFLGFMLDDYDYYFAGPLCLLLYLLSCSKQVKKNG